MRGENRSADLGDALRITVVVVAGYVVLGRVLVHWLGDDALIPLWAPSGFALAIALRDRRRLLPCALGVVIGEIILDVALNELSVTSTAWWAAANAAELVVAAVAVRRMLPHHDAPDVGEGQAPHDAIAARPPRRELSSTVEVGRLVGGLAIGAVAGGIVGTIGLAGTSPRLDYFWQWFLGDGLGLLAVAPFAFAPSVHATLPRTRREQLALAFVLMLATALVTIAFATNVPIAYLVPSMIGLVGLRARGLALPVALAAVCWALWSTAGGNGPFVIGGRSSLVQLQCFSGALIGTALMSAAVAAADERRRRRIDLTQERHRRLVDAASEVYIELEGPNGLIIDVNPRLAELFGVSPADIVGLYVKDLIPAAVWATIQASRDRVVGGLPAVFEVELPSPTGPRRLLVSSRSEVRNDGSTGRILLLATDVTEIHAERSARQQIEQRLLDVERAERTRLAQELHDGPVQLLVATDLHLGRLRRTLPLDVAAKIQPIERMIEDAIKSLRQGMLEIRPPDVQRGGLGPAIEECALLFLGGSEDIRVVLDVGLDPAPTGEVAEVLYKCAREAIANCVRHARCTRVEVSLTRTGNTVELTVRDNGRGVDPMYAQGREGHLGIGAMHTRAQDMGGHCAITSAGGTVVSVSLPEHPAASLAS